MKINGLTYNFLKIRLLGLSFFALFNQLNAQEASNFVDTTSIRIGEHDGAKIPISLVYHKDTKISSNTPLLQYAYGSYGSTIDPYFSTSYTYNSFINKL